MKSMPEIYIAVAVIALITLFTRAFPFLFFRKQPGVTIKFFENNIPPMVILILVLYCVKEVNWVSPPFGIPELLCMGLTALLHLWKGNSILSIFSGTALYMALVQTQAFEKLAALLG